MESPESPATTPDAGAGASADDDAGSLVTEVVDSGASVVTTPERDEVSSRVQRLWLLGALAFVSVLVFWRMSAFGIWDPQELTAADTARRLASGEGSGVGRVAFGTWLVSLGFRAFGVHEWAGRLPIALSGLICVATAYRIGARFADARTGLYAALITGTTPLFLFNSRMMIGAAPDMAVQSMLGFATLYTLLPPDRTTERRLGHTQLGLAISLMLAALAITTRGALLGALPALAAGVLVTIMIGQRARDTGASRIALLVLGALTFACVALVVRDVARDSPDYSAWLGGASTSTLVSPPTFDAVVEQVFHAFAPWSALLPLAMSQFWLAEAPAQEVRDDAATGDTEIALHHACLIWIALGYGSQTLFVSRYGREVTFLPVVALAVLVALFVRRVERRSDSMWGAAIAALLLAGLVLRDFALYPGGPVQGLPIASFEVPKIWNPARSWSAVLIPFGVCALFGLSVDIRARAKPDWRAPYRLLRTQWRRGIGFKLWLIAGGLVLVGVCVLAGLAYAIPTRLHMPTLALKWVRRLVFLPVVIAAAVAVVQWLFFGFARLGANRLLPLVVAGACAGVYVAQGFLPSLSKHFSPREVYSTYNELAGPGEPLGEYRVGSRAAAYYAKGEVHEVVSISDLVAQLSGPGRRWAAFPSDDLAEVDHAYRVRNRQHLVLVDARSANIVLAATQPVAGRKDGNTLRDAVRSEAPAEIQHPITVRFDDRVELLGYSLELPHDTYVGAGESFTLTWYFRTLRRISSGYRLFVHIDGEGQRIHGDHDPIDGKYPVQLWEPGDVIIDAQKIDVPASYRGGDYSILMGFYSGDTRLPIQQGPNDGENRARVGALRIQ